jgi:hypothetical protein
VYPGKEPPAQDPPTADDAAREYQQGLQQAAPNVGTSAAEAAALAELQAQMRKFEDEKAQWERQKQEAEAAAQAAAEAAAMAAAEAAKNTGDGDAAAAAEAAAQAAKALAEEAARQAERERELLARQVNDQELREVLPKMVELKQIVKALNRDMLSFETALQSSTASVGSDGRALGPTTTTTATAIPKVKIKVHNELTDETIFLDVFEFVKAHALLKDEVAFLRNAIMNDREYAAPPGHDPITLLFDNSFHVGSATTFSEYLLYYLETEPEETQLNIKLAVPPFNTVGKLEVLWTPLSSPEPDQHHEDDLPDVENPEDLVGKPWTYRIQIKGATGLPLITDLAYVQYEFMGELFTTESVEQNTRNPVFDYTCVHHVDVVTPGFVEFLQNARIEFQIFVNPLIMDPPKDPIASTNAAIVAHLGGEGKRKATYEGTEVWQRQGYWILDLT